MDSQRKQIGWPNMGLPLLCDALRRKKSREQSVDRFSRDYRLRRFRRLARSGSPTSPRYGEQTSALQRKTKDLRATRSTLHRERIAGRPIRGNHREALYKNRTIK